MTTELRTLRCKLSSVPCELAPGAGLSVVHTGCIFHPHLHIDVTGRNPSRLVRAASLGEVIRTNPGFLNLEQALVSDWAYNS